MDGTQVMPDFDALKTKLRATWMAGDFGEIAKAYTEGAEEFIHTLNFQPGIRVLDVACGTGNLAIPAARLGAVVTGVDIAPNLLEQGRETAEREGLSVEFDEGDAENLPYPDASFDAVVTMFGAMFTPRPEMTAAELKRVCRPGGMIAMANWTPTGFIGQMFKIVVSHVPPPPNVPSPVMWGREEVVRERLGKGVVGLETSAKLIHFTFPFGPAQAAEHFRVYYGPTINGFNSLDENGQAALRRELEQHWTTHNSATDGTTDVASEYLRIVGVRA